MCVNDELTIHMHFVLRPWGIHGRHEPRVSQAKWSEMEQSPWCTTYVSYVNTAEQLSRADLHFSTTAFGDSLATVSAAYSLDFQAPARHLSHDTTIQHRPRRTS